MFSLRCCCFAGHQLTAKQRRSHFGSGTNRKGRCYDTHHVWTFQAYEHIMDYSTFLLNMPFFKLDMVQVGAGLQDSTARHGIAHGTVRALLLSAVLACIVCCDQPSAMS